MTASNGSSTGTKGYVEFEGECVTVRLTRRTDSGLRDAHVLFEFMDGHGTNEFRGSCYWIPDLYNVMASVEHWLEENADLDTDGTDCWGYKFRGPEPVKRTVFAVTGREVYAVKRK